MGVDCGVARAPRSNGWWLVVDNCQGVRGVERWNAEQVRGIRGGESADLGVRLKGGPWLAGGGCGSSGECRDGVLCPSKAGSVDCQPVIKGKAGVAVAEAGGGGVSLQLRGERCQRAREAVQECEHQFRREQ